MTIRDQPPLTRAELIENVRHKVGISAREASDILETMIDACVEELTQGGQIYISELGRFSVRWTSQRPGRNPKTGDPAMVPAKNRPTFAMSNTLRSAMLASSEGSGPSKDLFSQAGDDPDDGPGTQDN
ncbi:MAG: HU family DNA-binding protein [Deltaproteobacteria bacterium]|nr:HU family DNA-binding protein [Deltaproteobacteria bacterium]